MLIVYLCTIVACLIFAYLSDLPLGKPRLKRLDFVLAAIPILNLMLTFACIHDCLKNVYVALRRSYRQIKLKL